MIYSSSPSPYRMTAYVLLTPRLEPQFSLTFTHGARCTARQRARAGWVRSAVRRGPNAMRAPSSRSCISCAHRAVLAHQEAQRRASARPHAKHASPPLAGRMPHDTNAERARHVAVYTAESGRVIALRRRARAPRDGYDGGGEVFGGVYRSRR